MKNILLTLLILVWTAKLSAQQINNGFFNKTEAKNALALSFDLDPAFFIGLEYERIFDINIKNFSRKLNAKVGVKTYGVYTDVNYGVHVFAFGQSDWNAIVNLAGETKFSSNAVSNGTAHNVIVSLMPGYFKEKWYLGAELMLKKGIAQHFKHTDEYKNNHTSVVDGWYDTDLMYYYFSLNTGFKLGEKVDLNFRVGYRATADFKTYSPYLVPFFLNLGVRYQF